MNNRPLVILWAFWHEVIGIEEDALFYPPEYLGAAV